MIPTQKLVKSLNLFTDRDRAMFRAYGMLRDRAIFWETEYHDFGKAGAYQSAADIVMYALQEDWAALNQFDYYDEYSAETKLVNEWENA